MQEFDTLAQHLQEIGLEVTHLSDSNILIDIERQLSIVFAEESGFIVSVYYENVRGPKCQFCASIEDTVKYIEEVSKRYNKTLKLKGVDLTEKSY